MPRSPGRTGGDDPTCTRNAVRNVRHKGTDQPSCWACIQRSYRSRDTNAEATGPGAA